MAVIRQRNYSIRTERAYLGWLERYLHFIGGREPAQAGAAQVKVFLHALAVQGQVAANTQNQALNALVFFYAQVLEQPLGELGAFARAKRPQRLPVVLTTDEVRRLLAALQGMPATMAALLYGTGMRLMECLRLRIKDVDFAYGQIVVRNGKGQKDRVVWPTDASTDASSTGRDGVPCDSLRIRCILVPATPDTSLTMSVCCCV